MKTFLAVFVVLSTFLVLYWLFWGQRRQEALLNPPKQAQLKAVLFDMDGTIVDSFGQWFKILNEAGKKYGLKPVSKKWFQKHIWGGSMENDAKKYFKTEKVDKIAHEYTRLKTKYICDLHLMKHADSVLKEIKKRGYKTALVTNTSRAPTEEALDCYGIREMFDAIITADDTDKRKPDPEPLLLACKELNLMNKEVIYVGDTKNDFKAARAAGIFMLGLNTRGHVSISALDDLLQLLPEAETGSQIHKNKIDKANQKIKVKENKET